MRPQNNYQQSTDGFEEKVLQIRRVSKKTKGGNTIAFSALVVVGDRKGKVGIGVGRGREVPQAIQKAAGFARRDLIEIPIRNDTITHEVATKYKAAKIILKPAPQGTGLKVGSVVRPILALGGVRNASGKILKSRNQITNARVVMEAIQKLKK